jgi:hypothetical protein
MINRKKLMRDTQADHHKSPPIKKKDMTGEEIEKWRKSTGGSIRQHFSIIGMAKIIIKKKMRGRRGCTDEVRWKVKNEREE